VIHPWRFSEEIHGPAIDCDWTTEEFQRWMTGLTPRQVIHQMRGWAILGDQIPAFADEFQTAITEARGVLRKARLLGV